MTDSPPPIPFAWSDVRFRTVELSDPAYEADGIRNVTVKSPALGRRADVTVASVPGADPDGPLPAVILLHGVFGSHWGWTRSGGAHRTLQRLVRDGRIGPAVLVMPSDGLFGDGSGYVPRPGQDAERWIVDEVMAAARLAIPGAGDGGVCLAGLSMGGWGALRLGAKYGSRYAAVAAMSSITDMGQMRYFVEEDVEGYELPSAEWAVADVIVAHRATLPAIRIDCGRDDPLVEPNRALHASLDAAGITHEYEEFDGGHSWAYWSAHLDEVLVFCDGALSNRSSGAAEVTAT